MSSAPATIEFGDARIAIATWNEEAVGAGDTIVLLHDGLGSIRQWRGVPERVAAATGRRVIAYERPGHGASTPVPTGPWPTRWLHHEADRLRGILDAMDVRRPVLVGHSDGGSIALIAAMNGLDCAGVVAIAMHTWVEPICRRSIIEMRDDADRFVRGLARYHDHPAAVFEAWSGVWVSDEFAEWDIRPDLHGIDAPTVISQGDADEYATAAMVTDTVEAIGDNARGIFVPGGRHLLHHGDEDAVVDLVTSFVAELGRAVDEP